LQLRLLPVPRAVTVTTREQRGTSEPIDYLDAGTRHHLVLAATPQRIVVDRPDASCARQYYQLLRADGAPVLIYREDATAHWYLAGGWE
jgi:hypothetical protein